MNIATVVIGLSLDLKGKENPIAKEAKFFGEEIKNSNDLVNVVYEKEWLTTVEARRQPDASHEVDDAAAALILQRYLDKVGPKTFVEEIEDDEETIEEKLV
jgi:RNase H-fold protein (predicted Holliday junction resolvase)